MISKLSVLALVVFALSACQSSFELRVLAPEDCRLVFDGEEVQSVFIDQRVIHAKGQPVPAPVFVLSGDLANRRWENSPLGVHLGQRFGIEGTYVPGSLDRSFFGVGFHVVGAQYIREDGLLDSFVWVGLQEKEGADGHGVLLRVVNDEGPLRINGWSLMFEGTSRSYRIGSMDLGRTSQQGTIELSTEPTVFPFRIDAQTAATAWWTEVGLPRNRGGGSRL